MTPRKKFATDSEGVTTVGYVDNVKTFRKKAFDVETVLWTGENLAEVLAWAGDIPGKVNEPAASWSHFWDGQQVLSVYNTEEKTTIPVPVGHRIVRGRLGELYPISPAALTETYEAA